MTSRSKRSHPKRGRNDGPWRARVLAKRGHWCRACGGSKDVQVDHVIPRSQGGVSDVENGLPLCGPFGNGCHDRKTAGAMLIERSWLDDEQIEYLAARGWVVWDEDGEVRGRGWKHFAPIRKETPDGVT